MILASLFSSPFKLKTSTIFFKSEDLCKKNRPEKLWVYPLCINYFLLFGLTGGLLVSRISVLCVSLQMFSDLMSDLTCLVSVCYVI